MITCRICNGEKRIRKSAAGDSDSRGQPSHYMERCWYCRGEGVLFRDGCTETDIESWIEDVNAKFLWSTEAPNGLARIEYFSYDKGMFFLLRFSTERKDDVSCQLFTLDAEAKG